MKEMLDNSGPEGFFSMLKTEHLSKKHYRTKNDLRDVFGWVWFRILDSLYCYLINIVRPPLHHCPPLLKIFGAIVRAFQLVTLRMC